MSDLTGTSAASGGVAMGESWQRHTHAHAHACGTNKRTVATKGYTGAGRVLMSRSHVHVLAPSLRARCVYAACYSRSVCCVHMHGVRWTCQCTCMCGEFTRPCTCLCAWTCSAMICQDCVCALLYMSVHVCHLFLHACISSRRASSHLCITAATVSDQAAVTCGAQLFLMRYCAVCCVVLCVYGCTHSFSTHTYDVRMHA